MMIRHVATFKFTLKNQQILINKSKSSISRILINPKPKPSFHSFSLQRCLSSFSIQTPCRRYVGYSNPFIGWCRNISTRSSSAEEAPPVVILDGCDFQHWLVVMEPPDPRLTRDDIIDTYVKTLALCLGSEEEARKSIYSVSTKHYFAFSCIVSEQLSNKIKELPKVRWVLPDSYLDVPNKTYGASCSSSQPFLKSRGRGEPFVNGQAVPYDPKYHERWVRNTMNSKNNFRKYRDGKRNDTDGFSARMIDRMMSNEMPSSSSHTSNPSTYPRMRGPGPASMEPPGQYYPPFPPAQPNFPSTGSLPGFQNQNLHSNNFPSSQNKTFENRENLQVQSFGPSTGSNMYPGQTAGSPNGNNMTPVQNPGIQSGNNMFSSGLHNTHPTNLHMPPSVPNHEFHRNGMPFHGEIQPPQSRQAENLQPGFQVIPHFVPNNEFHGNGMPFHVETQQSQFRQADAFHGNGMFHVENQRPQFRQAENFQPGFQVMPNFVPNQEFHGHGMPFHVDNQQPQFRQAEPGFQVMPRSLPNHEFHDNGTLFHVENQQPQFRQAENLQPGFQQMPRSAPNNDLQGNGMPSFVENQQPQFRQAENLQPGFQLMPRSLPNHEFHGNGMPYRVENQQPQFKQAENFQPEFRLVPRSEPNLEFHGNGMPSNVGNQQPQFRQAENLQPGFQQNRVVSMGNLPNHQNREAPDYARLANSQNRVYQELNMPGNTNPVDRDNRDYQGQNMPNSPYQRQNMRGFINSLDAHNMDYQGLKAPRDAKASMQNEVYQRQNMGFTNSIDYQGPNMQNSHYQGQNMPGFTNSFDTHNRDYQ